MSQPGVCGAGTDGGRGCGQHRVQVVLGTNKVHVVSRFSGMDENHGKLEGQRFAHRFQRAAGLAAIIGIRRRNQQVAVAKEKGGLGSVRPGAAIVGECSAWFPRFLRQGIERGFIRLVVKAICPCPPARRG